MSLSLDVPLRLPCGLQLPNRLAKAAMTEGLATCGGLPSPDLVRLYGRWATSGAGLLVTGNVGIDPEHPVRPRDVLLTRDSPLAPFRAWARVAQHAGARVIVQLNHAGRQTPRVLNPRPLGPSTGTAVKTMRAFGAPREATEQEIHDVVARHAEAASLAERAGFDGVQVHAAHGYLLNQFLSPDVNRRRDAWGGSVSGRARLLLECVRAVRAATGPGFAVAVKLNSGDFVRGGFIEEDALEVVALLDRERIDLLEISGGRYESAASLGHAQLSPLRVEGYFLAFARRAREATRAPRMLTGGLRSRRAIEAALVDGTLDIAGIARPMALVPDYPRRLLAGEELPRVVARPLGVQSLARLEGPAELAWYYRQIERLSRGLAADTSASPLWALFSFIAGDGLRALGRKLNKKLRSLVASPSSRDTPTPSKRQ